MSHTSAISAALSAAPLSESITSDDTAAFLAACGCRQCLRDRKSGTTYGGLFLPTELTQMIVCSECGNKRCPHATDHRLACTNSNAPGQAGSAYA